MDSSDEKQENKKATKKPTAKKKEPEFVTCKNVCKVVVFTTTGRCVPGAEISLPAAEVADYSGRLEPC